MSAYKNFVKTPALPEESHRPQCEILLCITSGSPGQQRSQLQQK